MTIESYITYLLLSYLTCDFPPKKKKKDNLFLMFFMCIYHSILNEYLISIQKTGRHMIMLSVNDRTAAIIRLNTAMEEVKLLSWHIWQPPLEMPCEFGVGIEPG